ncbi:DegV family protein [Spiroplasma clarkii]|uniref:DegV family protein n=1 Tax=Spiroplasma clarkii TaxID=2139 RepID=A0A1Y0L2V1_9MOLU|nr:DegV family protein [Spiroplasma clarkii]ARU92009.1 DegV family protein [Spiroplasma clarkii]ATX71343.1 DegV family protein [Spiroplasma clarkii]
MKTAIIIDSSTGIKDLSGYPNVFLAPLMIINSEGDAFKDDLLLTSDEFYSLNDKDLLKTSQTVVGDMYALWDDILKEYDNVICLLLSKGLSGQYATYKMLANEEQYMDRVFVVDTNGVAVVGKRQLDLAIKLLNEGKTPQEVMQTIETLYANKVGYIIPKSLTQLVRGGRISRAAAGLAKILKITPVLKYNGIIDKEDKTRTFKKAINLAITKIKEQYTGDYVIDVAYSRSPQEVLDEVLQLVKDAGFKIGLIYDMPNVIVCHTGRETFALIPHFEN